MKRPHLLIGSLLILLFTTCDDDKETLEEPQVLTNDVTKITSFGALFSAQLQLGTKEPVQHYGFIWDSNPNVSLNFAEKIDLGAATKSGEFTAEVNSALEPNARYYVRAFAISKQGNLDHLIYGNEVTFISLGSEAPKISEITPTTGNMGDSVVIKGKNFSSKPEKNLVHFGQVEAAVFAASSDQLIVRVPESFDVASVPVSVSVYGNIAEASQHFQLSPPVITGFSPTEGYSGTYFQVTGNNFVSGHTKLFLGEKEIEIQSITSQRISTYLPFGLKSGENTVKVTVFDQPTIAKNTFYNFSPEITSISPLNVAFGDTLTISGSGFLEQSWNEYVYIGDYYCQIISTSKSQLKVIVPDELYNIQNYVSVSVNGYSAQFDNPITLKPPVITSISPTKGPSGSLVTINGKNFNNYYWKNAVYFSNYSASINSVSRTQLVVTVPGGISGISDVKVEVASQTSELPAAFEVTLPEISDFSPKKGTKGTVVTIDGANFTSNASVYIGSAQCEIISVTDTQLQVRIASDVYENSGSVALNIGGTTVYGPEAFTFVWVRKSSPWYYGRMFTIGFSYNSKGYLGLGYDYTNQVDLNKYDAFNNYWTYETSLIDVDALGSYPASFLINENLYIYSRENNFFNAKVLKYNLDTKAWSGVANIPESRTSAVAFSSNGKGYLGLGLHENTVYTKNIFEYDPGSDSWSDIGNFPGDARTDATVMDIDGEIVVGFGQGETSMLKDLYKFNSANKTWTRLNDFPSSARSGCATFTINGIAYVVGGQDESGYYINEVWAYDISSDSWERKSDFVGNRFRAAAFSLNGKGYLGSGNDEYGYSYTGDLWEYDPSLDE